MILSRFFYNFVAAIEIYVFLSENMTLNFHKYQHNNIFNTNNSQVTFDIFLHIIIYIFQTSSESYCFFYNRLFQLYISFLKILKFTKNEKK